MASVFFANNPENEPIWKEAVGDSDLKIRRIGPYIELEFADGVTIDRVSTGARHAVWYSCVGAVKGASVVQFDKDALRVVAQTSS